MKEAHRDIDMAASDPTSDTVFFGLARIGETPRVTALDPAWLVEMTVLGPAATGEAALEALALRKLKYCLNRLC